MTLRQVSLVGDPVHLAGGVLLSGWWFRRSLGSGRISGPVACRLLTGLEGEGRPVVRLTPSTLGVPWEIDLLGTDLWMAPRPREGGCVPLRGWLYLSKTANPAIGYDHAFR